MQSNSWNEGLHSKLLKTPLSFWIPNNPQFNSWNHNLIVHLAVLKPSEAKNQNFCCTQVLNKLFWEELLTQNLIIATEKLPVTKQSQQLRSSDGDEMAKRQFQCDFHFRIWFRLTVLGLGKYQEVKRRWILFSVTFLSTGRYQLMIGLQISSVSRSFLEASLYQVPL